MRQASFFIFFLCISSCYSSAQKNKKLKAPAGTIQINDTLFADKTEITNVHYREYLWWLAKYDSTKYEKMLPDTTVWFDTLVINEYQTTQFYFRHPGFNDYPVVGVSYEQAIEYCKWRTLAVNYYTYCKENNLSGKSNFTNETFPIKVYYRLPIQQEWEMLATGKLSIDKNPYGNDSVYTKWKKKYWKAFNCKYPLDKVPDSLGKERAFYTANVKSFFSNSNHLYNMIGNVGEMIAEKGISKGGSFAHTPEESKISSIQFYTKPERWLGFRCVAVIIR
jgi:formylglycine-generating enzyme required for sulfatase activity